MTKLLIIIALAAAPARAEFRPFNSPPADAEPISFCDSGKFVIASGSCSPKGKKKDVISPKACRDVASALYDGLMTLYPNASVEYYEDLPAGEVMEKLLRPQVLGFFFVGEGDIKGGFVTGPERDRLYPEIGGCMSGTIQLFGGFTSHSKYSPDSPARKSDRALVISRLEMVYDGAKAMPGSWPRLCKPRISLVYPTRTFAGRMKDDVKKMLAALMDEKRKHVLKALEGICGNCPGHLEAGNNLARLCPPNSDVCRQRKIIPGTEKLILENYCSALSPTATRADQP